MPRRHMRRLVRKHRTSANYKPLPEQVHADPHFFLDGGTSLTLRAVPVFDRITGRLLGVTVEQVQNPT